MAQSREQFQTRLLNAYSNWYDLTHFGEEDAPLVAEGVFHEHGTSYLLIKSAKMWEADRNEYLYLFSMPHLTKAGFEQCVAKARELGEPQIIPDKNHMCSYVVAAILCDTADEDAVEALTQYRQRKSFQFSLQGWMEVHTALIEFGKDSVVSNPDGRKTAKFLKSVLHPPAQRGGLLQRLLRK